MSTSSRKQILSYITDYNDFDVWECVAKCENEGDLDAISGELKDYQTKNKDALVELINSRFEELVFLSKTLSEIKELTNEIKYPMMVLEKSTTEQIRAIQDRISKLIETLTLKYKTEEQNEKDKNEQKITRCYDRLNKNLENPKSAEQLEVACYQLEMVKYLVHTFETANCSVEISKTFGDLGNRLHALIDQFLLDAVTAQNQKVIDICTNCYGLLGEMEISQPSLQK
ncbi:hypothetical protein EIN_024010 [Entamoeba invadens IP1]|uniref:hypothetical protein n=1 Tax=Entamoeba invadens IP1 TaxID=370355 RepID=UPI0002C3DADB|nr:hypothetical protein EIN_024010 [Entamoeba invadens IP1]ELP90692.1 hypothetical protein EIN_024010 [Entamoeba invadens IP1]|eukprot:XP_004257463.1 hypothetical protein EIN_024010 [Entamoeba invadens IP1]